MIKNSIDYLIMRQDTGGSEPIEIERDQRHGREPTDMDPAY